MNALSISLNELIYCVLLLSESRIEFESKTVNGLIRVGLEPSIIHSIVLN